MPMVTYRNQPPRTIEPPPRTIEPPPTMGFVAELVGGLIGVGTTVASHFMAEGQREKAEAAQRAAEREAWEASRQTAREEWEYQLEMARLAGQQQREAVAAAGKAERLERLKQAQLIEIVAIGGAIFLGVVGVGMLMKTRQ